MRISSMSSRSFLSTYLRHSLAITMGYVMAWAFVLSSRVSPSRAFAFASRSSSSFHQPAVSSVLSTTSHLLSSSSSSSTTASSSTDASSSKKTPQSLIPMILLGGFLGSGKTTTLKHLLENTENVRIGLIINDVASINIDAKLVASTSQDGLVELQNGCACCSLADELLTSVETMLHQRTEGRRRFDALVVELSGVADPVAIQQNWKVAKQMKHPATQLTDMSRIVTVVDASTFGTDYMTWDVAYERDGWVNEGDDGAGTRKVPELLAEQVEAANIILINKIDIAGKQQTQVASEVARGLNPKAELQEVEFGKVAPQQILGKPLLQSEVLEEHSSSHDSHDHSHSHDHGRSELDCTDESHSHAHSHSHDDHVADCTDPDCTDSSHSHSHSHSTSTDILGIMSFVYKAEKPFETQRLMALLNQWPIPIKDYLDLKLLHEAQEDGYELDGRTQAASPFLGVLRSKGFCWLGPTQWSGRQSDVWRHDTAMFWSHAGKHFGISSAGKWWGTIPKDRMNDYFVGNEQELERLLREDFVSDEWGDRRQEIVFIGTNLNEREITSSLDDCLCTDKEMDGYRQRLRNYMDDAMKPGTIPGLFDVGGTDHMDQEQ